MSLRQMPDTTAQLRSQQPGAASDDKKTATSAGAILQPTQGAGVWHLAAREANEDPPPGGVTIDCESASASNATATASAANAACNAASGAVRMTGSAPAATPASPHAARTGGSSYAFAGYCAFVGLLSLATGVVFTLKATATIPGAFPDAPDHKAAAGAAFLFGLGATSCAVWSALKTASRTS